MVDSADKDSSGNHETHVTTGKKAVTARRHKSLSAAGKKGAKARSHESRVKGGMKAAATRGHESLSAAGKKGAQARSHESRVKGGMKAAATRHHKNKTGQQDGPHSTNNDE